jgi:integrase/recombinase XerD
LVYLSLNSIIRYGFAFKNHIKATFSVGNSTERVVFLMEIGDALIEYDYHCVAKGYTAKTMINKRQEYKQLRKFLEEKRGIAELESVTVHDMKAYVSLKRKAGLTPQSIQSMFKMIKAFFNWCIEEEYLTENPCNKVETPKIPKKVLKGFTADEVGAMIRAFSSDKYLEVRNKAIIAMLADCGLRAMEIRSLRFSDVKDTSILVQGKGDKERMVYISPALKKILIKYERLRRKYFMDKVVHEDRYFLSYQGNGLSHYGLHKVILDAGKRAKIKGVRVSPHTFRHFFAVTCLQQGLDLHSLSRLLGHTNVIVTQRYLQSMSDEQLFAKALSSSPLMTMNKKKTM